MILPIIAYGDPVLKKVGSSIDKDYKGLTQLIENMFETMYAASGVGLAAPQVGISIRLFIVDTKPFAEDEPELENFKKVFINPQIIEEVGDEWKFNEGCLSIPGIREDVMRKKIIEIAQANKIAVYEISVMQNVLLGADELFLTNTINGIRWVVAYKQKRYFNDTSQKLTQKLNELVAVSS